MVKSELQTLERLEKWDGFPYHLPSPSHPLSYPFLSNSLFPPFPKALDPVGESG